LAGDGRGRGCACREIYKRGMEHAGTGPGN